MFSAGLLWIRQIGFLKRGKLFISWVFHYLELLLSNIGILVIGTRVSTCKPQFVSLLNNVTAVSVSATYCNKTFWEELIVYFRLMLHWLHGKRRVQQISFSAVTCLLSHFLATIKEYTRRPTDSLILYELCRNVQVSNNSSIVACVRCHGNVYTEPLRSNDTQGYTCNEADLFFILYFWNPILFAICTNIFSRLCKRRIQWHVEECSVALLCN
jgi:hypothetical protein